MYTTLISAHALSQTTALIIDVRHDLMNPAAGRAAYCDNHINGAYFLHLDDDLSGQKTGHNGRHPLPNLDQLAHTLRGFGLNNQMQVVIYDAGNSMMAARAWWLLRDLGHEAVAVLDGGLAAWQRAQLPLTTTFPSAATVGTFMRKPSLCTQVSAADLMAHLHDGSYQVVDARAPERFSGEVEPIDPIGGHIPQAINCFFMNNLNPDLTFKSPALLKQLWQDAFKHPHIVNQCGSGVTACHNILAQNIAGFENAALYAGSWSEWCSDASRPVATGATP